MQLKHLNIDLSENNVKAVGTTKLCLSIGKIETLSKLSLNLDVNDIKNKGAL
jgi:hypothetical protein